MFPAVGSRVGRYEIVGPLGAGGMGAVYRAHDRQLDRLVAIKILTASSAAAAQQVRFEHEARAIARLSHPHICTLYDVGQEDGRAFMVMELLDGNTLAAELAHGPLALERAVAFGIQIAEALDAAHSRGVIHLDLKPSNVMVTGSHVKLLDFGVAQLRDVDEHTDAHDSTVRIGPPGSETILGSYPYMSPEQLQGRRTDARSDIFALGVVLYEMATGSRPFRADNRAALTAAILTLAPPPVSSLSAAPPLFDRIVARCLEKDPDGRWQTARDLASALRWTSESEFSGVVPVTNAARSTRRRGLRRWAAAFALIAGLAVLAAVVLRLPSNLPFFRSPLPSFDRLTFQRGLISSARFAPDGETIIYSAAWEGRAFELFLTRVGEGSSESRPLQLSNARILSVSRSGELAFIIGAQQLPWGLGVLSRSPLSGMAPRQVLENVREADWIGTSSDLAVVRRAGTTDVLEFPIGRRVHESAGLWSMRVSPDGTRAAMFEGSPAGPSGDVIVIDRSGQRTVLSQKWLVGYGLAWSPRGDEVWFTGTRGEEVFALHAVSLAGAERPLLRTPRMLHLHDVSPAGGVLLGHVNGRSELWCLPPGAQQERDLSWLDGPWVQSLTSDGQYVLFSEERSGGGRTGVVYLRKTDGSAAVRLAEGRTEGLSPDGKWALTLPAGQPESPTWTIVPTGAGSPHVLPAGGFVRIIAADWLADSRRIVFTAIKPNERSRIYVQDVQEGLPKSISPEGFTMPMNTATPNGRFVVGSSDKGLFLVPVDGGELKPLPGISGIPLQWSADGRFVFVRRGNTIVEIHRVEVATGRTEPWRTLGPPDRVGVERVFPIVMTPDGTSYCYTANRNLSDLFAVSDVR